MLERLWNPDNERVGALRRFTDFNAYRTAIDGDEHAFVYSTYNDFGDVFAYETADFWTWWTEKVNEYETRGEYLLLNK